MNHSKLIDELLNELSYRVGIVNLKNKNQQSIISEILSEWEEYDVKQIIMEFLTNEDDAKQDGTKEKHKGHTHIGAGVFVRDSDVDSDGKAKKGAQKYKSDGKTLTAISDDEYQKTKSAQGKDGEKAAATTPQNKQGDGNEKTPEDIKKEKGVEKTVGSSSDYAKREKERVDKVNGTKSKGDKKKENSQEEIINTFSTEKDDIIQGKKSPPGTGGSAIGEMYGGTAISEFYESPLSEDEFIENHFKDVRNSSMSKGMDDKAIRTWLKVSYKTGVSEVNELKNNSKYRFKEPQSKPFPIPVMDPVNKKGSARKSLISFFEQKLENAKDDVAKKHYERQLKFIKSREDSDTGVLYETEEGNVGFKHTSNKKSFTDPVFNSTVNKRGEVMKSSVAAVSEQYNLDEGTIEKVINNIDSTVQKAVISIQEAGKGPSGALNSNVSDTFEFAKKHKLGNQFKNLDGGQGGRKNYLEDIKKEISTNLGLGKKVNKVLEERGIPQPYSDDDISGAILELSKSGDTTSSVTKMVVKLSDNVKLAREVYNRMRTKYPNLSDEELKEKTLETINGYKNKNGEQFDVETLDTMLSSEMDWIEKVGAQTRDAMGEAHKQIVTDLSNSDEKWQRENSPNQPQPPTNGPHKQAYIESYMKQMHWDRYILGEQEDIGDMNVAGKTVNSEHIRGCLGKLSGYEGDLSTPEGKSGLMSHLRKTMQISSESQSLTFNSKDGEKPIELGKEQYRTKGVGVNSLLGNFGKDLQACLKKS